MYCYVMIFETWMTRFSICSSGPLRLNAQSFFSLDVEQSSALSTAAVGSVLFFGAGTQQNPV